jgi:hypothetical protein
MTDTGVDHAPTVAATSTFRAARPRAAAAAASAPRAQTNYPRADSERQAYGPPHQSTVGLTHNCQLLDVAIIDGGDSAAGDDAGRGLRLEKNVWEAGAIIGWMWGKFVTDEEWIQITEGVDTTYVAGHEDFTTPATCGIWRCVGVPQQVSGATHLVISEQCPMAYINHITPTPWVDDSPAPNVRLDIPEYRLDEFDSATAYEYIAVRTQRAIVAGEELFLDYQWEERSWEQVRKLRSRARSSAFPSSKKLKAHHVKPHGTPAAFAGEVSAHAAHPSTPEHQADALSSDEMVDTWSGPLHTSCASNRRFAGPFSRAAEPISSGSDSGAELRRKSLVALNRAFLKHPTDHDLTRYCCCVLMNCHTKFNQEQVTHMRSVSHTSVYALCNCTEPHTHVPGVCSLCVSGNASST